MTSSGRCRGVSSEQGAEVGAACSLEPVCIAAANQVQGGIYCFNLRKQAKIKVFAAGVYRA